jgi:hypothetical protein
MFNPYAKAIIVAAIALASGIYGGYDDGVLTASEVVISVSVAVTGLLVVWAVAHPMLKIIAGSVTAGAAALATGLEDNVLTVQEWLGIIVATLTALVAVSVVRNTPPRVNTS